MTVADEHVARIGSVLDNWDRADAGKSRDLGQRLPACARQDLAMREALEPVTVITLKLAFGPAPGTDAVEDASWAASVALARRNIAAQQAAGIDHGLAARSLLLLHRIDSLIRPWPDTDWDDLARDRVWGLVDAGQRGRQRGQELRRTRQRSGPDSLVNVGWLLRHPTDQYLRRAAATVTDATCREIIEGLIGVVEPTYEQCGLDWSVQARAPDLLAEIRVREDQAGRWNTPTTASVISLIDGTTSHEEPIAIRLVQDADAPFNGTLVSFASGERWLLCARKLDDGTLLPLDGTRRLTTRPR